MVMSGNLTVALVSTDRGVLFCSLTTPCVAGSVAAFALSATAPTAISPETTLCLIRILEFIAPFFSFPARLLSADRRTPCRERGARMERRSRAALHLC
jgi:hypothetical protein